MHGVRGKCRFSVFSWERESQDIAEEGGNWTNAGAFSVAWFVLKQSDELVQNVFSCFGN